MYTATLHYKPTAKFTPDFYAKEVGTEWIVYPWERKDSDAVQDTFEQQRGFETNTGGQTNDVRALREKGILEQPLSQPRKVTKDATGSSFYGDE